MNGLCDLEIGQIEGFESKRGSLEMQGEERRNKKTSRRSMMTFSKHGTFPANQP